MVVESYTEEQSYRQRSLRLTRRYRWVFIGIIIFASIGLWSLAQPLPREKLIREYPNKISQVFSSGKHTTQGNAFLHLIVPATSSNKNFCRCLLSVIALGYPAPILINWAAKEAADPYVQHLGKVKGILDYLNGLAEASEDDLVLIVDGYDLWFQLRPEVLINRYFEVIDQTNARLDRRFGRQERQELGIYSSILLGADKISWPENPSSPETWTVPESTLSEHAFGPETDSHGFRDYNRPRWLNSGTIMGPVGDIRALLRGTLQKIEKDKAKVKSDQHYMALLFADQEYGRILKAEGPLDTLQREQYVVQGYFGENLKQTVNLTLPNIQPGQETDYHIAIDYDSALFQTMAYYRHYFGWQKYDGENFKRGLISHDMHTDILESPPPFASSLASSRQPRVAKGGLSIPYGLSWRDVSLGTNTISKRVFPILHFTPPKEYITLWWTRMWFYPYAESIIRLADEIPSGTYGKLGDGRRWWPTKWAVRNTDGSNNQGAGAFAPNGVWLGWNDLCQPYEPYVFRNELLEGEKPFPPHLKLKSQEAEEKEKEKEKQAQA